MIYCYAICFIIAAINVLSYFNSLCEYSDNEDFLILVFGDTYYFHTIRNFYYSIIVKHNISRFVVATISLKSFYAYRNASIPVELIQYNTTKYEENTKVFSKQFIEKMQIRAYSLYFYMKNGNSLIHIDADTYFFTNPIKICKMKRNVDILFACDGIKCKYYNTGYMYIYYSLF